jgi:hypothetical protein
VCTAIQSTVLSPVSTYTQSIPATCNSLRMPWQSMVTLSYMAQAWEDHDGDHWDQILSSKMLAPTRQHKLCLEIEGENAGVIQEDLEYPDTGSECKPCTEEYTIIFNH